MPGAATAPAVMKQLRLGLLPAGMQDQQLKALRLEKHQPSRLDVGQLLAERPAAGVQPQQQPLGVEAEVEVGDVALR